MKYSKDLLKESLIKLNFHTGEYIYQDIIVIKDLLKRLNFDLFFECDLRNHSIIEKDRVFGIVYNVKKDVDILYVKLLLKDNKMIDSAITDFIELEHIKTLSFIINDEESLQAFLEYINGFYNNCIIACDFFS